MKNREKIVTWLSYLIGAIGGLVYYRFYSCDNGCAITSNPYLTMLFGALIFGTEAEWLWGTKSFIWCGFAGGTIGIMLTSK